MSQFQPSHSMIDALSGLGSRERLLVDLNSESFKLLYALNIDDFSGINDAYGLESGDYVLKVFSKRLSDIASGKDARIYRISSDEFVILYLKKFDNLKEVKNNAFLVIDKVSQNVSFEDGSEVIVSATCGIAFGFEDILRKAQITLRVARRNNIPFAIFKESYLSLGRKKERSMKNLAKYKNALINGEVLVYYQPIRCNKTDTTIKYEALARLKYNNEIIPPFYFIDLSKQLKLYSELSIHIVKKAIDDFKNREEMLSINISVEDICNTVFVKEIMQIGKRLKRMDNIIFEITESASIHDYVVINNFIKRISRFGIKISLDDFGTEYSNFEHLSRIDAHYLKIDGTFIKDINKNEKNYKLVESIVGLCKNLGIETVAEFVSSKEIYDAVRDIGIDFSQGYYFGEAVSLETIENNEKMKDN